MVFHRDVLILSPYPDALAEAVRGTGDRPRVAEAIESHPDWIVSFGHRAIIREPQLTQFRDRIVNLHISLLPWGRGADPNLWAWIKGEPHGVTLHYVDDGLDTGDIIAQREIRMESGETLLTSYEKLRLAAEHLFAEAWPALRNGRAGRTPQPQGLGSYHRLADRKIVSLPHGWRTPVAQLPRQTG